MSSSIVWITFYLSQDPNIHITSRLANMDMETTWLPWKWSNFQWNFHMSMWVYSRVNFMQSLRFRHRETAIMKPPSPRLGQVPGHGKSMPHGTGDWPHFYGTSPGENHGKSMTIPLILVFEWEIEEGSLQMGDGLLPCLAEHSSRCVRDSRALVVQQHQCGIHTRRQLFYTQRAPTFSCSNLPPPFEVEKKELNAPSRSNNLANKC